MSANNTTSPQDNFEKMMEQGAASGDPKAKMMAQMGQGVASKAGAAAGGAKTNSGLSALTSLGDPDAWVKDLYGLPQTFDKGGGGSASEKNQAKKDKNHTPLDKSKLESKYSVSPEQRRFFKKYQQEYEQFLQEKKKKVENEKRQEEEDEKKKKEEAQKRKQEEEGQIGGGQGKQKQRLGQPRRKATTELHPETKAGGAK